MHSDDESAPPPPPAASGKTAGWNQYTDDQARMGAIVARHYTGFHPDNHHKKGCPGCKPELCPEPDLSTWRKLEAKWRDKGDPPSCDIERQAWFTAANRGKPWWNEERDSIAHYNPNA